MPIHFLTRTLHCIAACTIGFGTAKASDARTSGSNSLPEIEVVGTVPLPGGEVQRDRIPTPVQTADSDKIERSHSVTLAEFMNRFMGSVYVNDVQNNPLQPDLNYRGYTASPLLGTPQGLAVYMDGMRMNQPFGDVVSWDLIPRGAVRSITLVPGSNPLFGLNALGGALAIQTKSGLSNPGTTLESYYGSHARRSIEVDHGARTDNGFNWFITGNLFRENGWRDESSSSSDQLFGKLKWQGEQTDLGLTTAVAKSLLKGNAMQEFRLLANDHSSVYTKPDITDNRSALVSLGIAQQLATDISLSGNAYFRKLKSSTYNGDINEASLDQALYQPTAAERTTLAAAGYSGFPLAGESAANTPFPYWRCIANVLSNEEPNEKCNGLVNRTGTKQQVLGASAQLSVRGSIAEHDHRLSIGTAVESSRAEFEQSTEFGYLQADRSIATTSGPGAYADGTQNSEDAFDANVELVGHTRTWSLYASDTVALRDNWHLTLSGRYYRARLNAQDLITPSGAGSLTGDHTFTRFNPAIGMTATPFSGTNFYAGVNQNSRAPSAIELGCADPENPCKLPNALAGDPPLDQVVSTTWELGARAAAGAEFDWRAGIFHTENRDDILFVADDQSGFGYFANFGKTLRQGIELEFRTQWAAFSVGANYTFLDATYRSEETLGGTGNSSNDVAQSGNAGFEGTIDIEPGDRIPLIPRHTFKAFIEYAINDRFSVAVDAIAISPTFARGNENNLHEPDGVFYLGSGETPGYSLLNMSSEFRPTRSLTLFAQITNALDKKYYTGAQLGPTGLRTDGTFIARPFGAPVIDGERPLVQSTFYSPGAPRAFSVGVRYRVD